MRKPGDMLTVCHEPTKPKILLTDEEIQTIIKSAPEPYDEYLALPIALLLQAQLRKVVEDIKEHSGTEQLPFRDGGILLRTMTESYFQALLNEVKEANMCDKCGCKCPCDCGCDCCKK